MAFPDLKDVGILAGFVRWGWPWHGLCEGGVIGTSGKTITQPATGDSWLIDKGLPPLDIDPAVVISEAAAGREWRNYALIHSNKIYDTHIGQDAYVFVDEDGDNWLIDVNVTFPGTANLARINLSIVRFGVFKPGGSPDTPVIKSIDVPCEAIELTNPYGGPFYDRWGEITDVLTNGSKALVCVFMLIDPGYAQKAIFSAIELVLSGKGGVDGSGLVVAASEVKGQGALTSKLVNTGANGPIASTVFGWVYDIVDTVVSTCNPYIPSQLARTWSYSTTGFVTWSTSLYDSVTDNILQKIICRVCRYDSAGVVEALRLKYEKSTDHWVTAASPGNYNGQVQLTCDGNLDCSGLMPTGSSISIAGAYKIGFYFLKNDTVIDYIEWREEYAGTQTRTPSVVCGPTVVSNYIQTVIGTTYASTGRYWGGPHAGSLPNPSSVSFDPFTGPDQDLFVDWADIANHKFKHYFLTDGVTSYGLNRDGGTAALFVIPSGGSVSYGPVATPLGNKTTSLTASFYFAWQRKTGDFAFSANPICYV